MIITIRRQAGKHHLGRLEVVVDKPTTVGCSSCRAILADGLTTRSSEGTAGDQTRSHFVIELSRNARVGQPPEQSRSKTNGCRLRDGAQYGIWVGKFG
ncbi:MAG: hypothetical protein ACRDTT_07220 [Pseudonocardiaceae bacterium]